MWGYSELLNAIHNKEDEEVEEDFWEKWRQLAFKSLALGKRAVAENDFVIMKTSFMQINASTSKPVVLVEC